MIYSRELLKKMVVEVDGQKHHLVYDKGLNPCAKCSLENLCTQYFQRTQLFLCKSFPQFHFELKKDAK